MKDTQNSGSSKRQAIVIDLQGLGLKSLCGLKLGARYKIGEEIDQGANCKINECIDL